MNPRTGAEATNPPLSGERAEERERPLRFAVFGGSIVSELENPAATALRLLLRELTRQGHNAEFFEPRTNATMLMMLHTRGATGMQAFRSRWPEIQYRSIDVPLGRDVDVWLANQLARLVATSDVVLVLDTAPMVIRVALAQMANPRLVRIFVRTQDDFFPESADYALITAPLGAETSGEPTAPGGVVRLGPTTQPAAWQPNRSAAPPRSTAILAYGEPNHEALATLIGDVISRGYTVVKRLALGPWSSDGWERVVESELPDVLAEISAAVVIPGGTDRLSRLLAQGQAFEPLSLGIPTITLGSASDYPLLAELNLLWESTEGAPFARSVEAIRDALPTVVGAETQVNALKTRATELRRAQLRLIT
jgi:hypothetical protein